MTVDAFLRVDRSVSFDSEKGFMNCEASLRRCLSVSSL